jgi:quinol monooxygenase YgiN
MHTLTGYLEFPPERRVETLAALREVTEQSRLDPGCVDYWWAEDLERPDRFRFFECWTTVEAFDAHQARPYEVAFLAEHVSHITGFDAHVLDVSVRRSVLEG